MKGDFTRNTFDPRNHFSRVLMQQGRVQLDADWNEQGAILLYHLQTLAADLLGPHWGPAGDCGFTITPNDQHHFTIGRGRYYVDGILCENETPLYYGSQPNYPLTEEEKRNNLKDDGSYLVYLDVWERHITYIQDPTIREVALGGPDTATRAKVMWQVKVMPVALDEEGNTLTKAQCEELMSEKLKKQPEPLLRARAYVKSPPEELCITPPEARYRGAENQLYRVEIHTGSPLDKQAVDENYSNSADNQSVGHQPTFKWSRDNGSVVFPIRNLFTGEGETTVILEHLGRDSRLNLELGDWVEIVDDDYAIRGRAEPLLRVSEVVRSDRRIILKGTPVSQVGQDPDKHPLLRRWDQKETTEIDLVDGAVPVQEEKWLDLEDGVQIYFSKANRIYRTGDYWLIPARTATGDVEWPQGQDDEGSPTPKALPPLGIEHHYAPLAIISVDGSGDVTVEIMQDCRRSSEPVWKLSE